MSDYTHKRDIVYKNQFHILWCPKYRRPVLKDGVDTRLKEILYEVADQRDITIKALEVMPDHVHLFIEFDPRMAVHKIIKDFKSTSARILRSEFPYLVKRLPSMWTRSYFLCSVGHINEDTVTQYIKSQHTRYVPEGKA